jgi:hypothetical protein
MAYKRCIFEGPKAAFKMNGYHAKPLAIVKMLSLKLGFEKYFEFFFK